MRRAILLTAVVFGASAAVSVLAARAEGKGEAVEYKDGNVALEGYLAMPSGKPRAGVLVVHEWWGLDDHSRRTADRLAALGYAAFALDMYGKGVLTNDPKEAGALAGKVRGGSDRKVLRQRAAAGLEILKTKGGTAENAAIGFCFGGTTVLELARSGADLKGVVCFHGGLATPDAADAKNIKGKVLVCNGGDDGFVKPEEIVAFEKEMRDAKVDWELINFGGAVHAFTNPDADKHGIPGIAYNERADKRSWKAMQDFFDEIFK